MLRTIKNPVNCANNLQEHLTDVLSSFRKKMMTHSKFFFKYGIKPQERSMCHHGKS